LIIEYALQPNHSEWSSFIAQFETKKKAKEVYKKLINWIKEDLTSTDWADLDSGETNIDLEDKEIDIRIYTAGHGLRELVEFLKENGARVLKKVEEYKEV